MGEPGEAAIPNLMELSQRATALASQRRLAGIGLDLVERGAADPARLSEPLPLTKQPPLVTPMPGGWRLLAPGSEEALGPARSEELVWEVRSGPAPAAAP